MVIARGLSANGSNKSEETSMAFVLLIPILLNMTTSTASGTTSTNPLAKQSNAHQRYEEASSLDVISVFLAINNVFKRFSYQIPDRS